MYFRNKFLITNNNYFTFNRFISIETQSGYHTKEQEKAVLQATDSFAGEGVQEQPVHHQTEALRNGEGART